MPYGKMKTPKKPKLSKQKPKPTKKKRNGY